jgi:hypothetical protein
MIATALTSIGVAALTGMLACSAVGQAKEYLKESVLNSEAIRRQ